MDPKQVESPLLPEHLRGMNKMSMADIRKEDFESMDILPHVLLIRILVLAFQDFSIRRGYTRKVQLLSKIVISSSLHAAF